MKVRRIVAAGVVGVGLLAAPGASATEVRSAGSGAAAGQGCAFESGRLRVALHGLPRVLTAGGAWSPFTATLTNTTGKTLERTQPFLSVTSAAPVDRPYWEVETEYRDARTGRWKSFHDATSAQVFGSSAVGPHSTKTLRLRTRAVKEARAAAGYAVAAGDYLGRDGSCGSSQERWYDFTIRRAGQSSAGAAGAAAGAATGKTPTCSEVDTGTGDYPHHNVFQGRTFGVPGPVALGSRWTRYTATVTNASAFEMKSFKLSGELGSHVYNEGERDLSPYADLQYWDTSKQAWRTLRRAGGNAGGSVPAPTTLKPRTSVHVQVRFRLHENLPLDQVYDAFTGLYATFGDRHHGIACRGEGFVLDGFHPTKG
ncbi:hypothetical protein [Streptomyces sp. NPDC089919]|uniref:hypothetical protein n=1 Tax=Streptomyces sp. NPDC089919 TaxID=3155188 RepID=UPI00341F5170